ncbi:MAG TPA: hypothetical protein VKY73_00420 [Polyangiaceae bacterium]|nr:hypothetical protein [Polyangiaceae bacterium]
MSRPLDWIAPLSLLVMTSCVVITERPASTLPAQPPPPSRLEHGAPPPPPSPAPTATARALSKLAPPAPEGRARVAQLERAVHGSKRISSQRAAD